MSDPIPVIPLEYQKPTDADARGRAWWWVNRVALLAGVATALIGWLALFANVRSVVIAGPVLGVIGAVMLLGGLRRRQPWIWGLGLAHCGVCLLFVALVNILHWSPRQAEQPFLALGAAYNLLSLPAAAWAWVWRAG